MVIRELKLYHFGKFHQKSLSLRPGINIIYGGNEAGKSTIHRFIKAMLFGVTRLRGKGAANDDYSRCQPWDDVRGYEGLMIFEHGGKRYRIYRNFYKEDEQFSVFDDVTGAEIVLKTGRIDELIPGLTEANYKNTISIAQQESRLDDRFASSLQSYMVNMSMSHDGTVDIGRALASLNEEEKKIKAHMPADRMEKLKRDMMSEVPVEETQRSLVKTEEELRKKKEVLTKQINECREKISEVRARERRERMEGLKLLEQRRTLLLSLKKEEDHAEKRKDVGLFGQWSFRIFLLLTVLAAAWMLIQWGMGLDRMIYKVLAGVLLAGAFIAAAKTSFKKPEDVIDVESYENELQSIQKHLSPYIKKYGQQLDGPGYSERLQKNLEQLNEESASVTSQLERLAWEKEQLEEKRVKIEDVRAAYEQAAEENRKYKKELEAVALAKMVISDLSGEIHQKFGKQLNEQVADIFSEIAGQESRSVIIDEKLNVRLDGTKQLIPLNRLSVASIDQIYFALRFCTGSLIFEDEQMPMIMDDCFAYYDDMRLKRILEWLSGKNRAQIILFTCHHREEKILDELGCGYSYTVL